MQTDEWQDHATKWLRSKLVKRLLEAAIVFLAVFLLLLFLYAAWRRVGYPYEVEWIESNMLATVLRILHGQGVYVAPSLQYVPFLYAPLYLYLSAVATKVVGLGGHGYEGLRLVWVAATLVSCGAIYALVRSESVRKLPAVAAAGMYVGCYALLGTFFDIGRVDSLFVCLLLLALVAQRRGYLVVSALFWVLTAQTKQTMLPMAFLILCAEWKQPRRLLMGLGTYVAAAAGSILVLHHATGGWYSYYLFGVAKSLPVVWRQAALYVPQNVLAPMGIAWVAIAAAVVLTRPRLKSDSGMFYVFVSAGLMGGVWFVQAHRGASENAMMPVFAWVAVMFGVAIARLLDESERSGAPQLAVLVLLAATAQLTALIYNPGRYVPTQSMRVATDEFIEQLRQLPGDVYVINHSYDAWLAGKPMHAEGEALGAVLDAPPSPKSQAVRKEFEAAKRNRRFTAVVGDTTEVADSFYHVNEGYPLAISTGLGPFRYVTSQAQWFLLPCDAPVDEVRRLEGPATRIEPGACGAGH